MKILMVLQACFPPDRRVEREALTLLKAGHELFLLSVAKKGNINEEVVKGIKIIRKELPQRFLKRAWNYLYFQAFSTHPFWEKALEGAVKQYEIEAIHIHDLPLVNTGLKIAHKFNLPLIADLHEHYSEAIKLYLTTWKQKVLSLLMPPWRWKRLERLCIQQANRVITVADETKQNYMGSYGVSSEKVTVVMNTEDLEYFYSLPIKEDIIEKYQSYFTISYIGGFAHHRGVQTAILAMSKILSGIPNACLILVGSGPSETELRELANDEGVAEAVDFTGWQDFMLLPSYIAASQVCLHTYIDTISLQAQGGTPNKIFQYMAMSKPIVVASSQEAAKRIISKIAAGLVYSAGDPQSLAEAVIKLYQNSNLADRMGKAGRKAVREEYNWEREAEKLIALYQDLEKSIR